MRQQVNGKVLPRKNDYRMISGIRQAKPEHVESFPRKKRREGSASFSATCRLRNQASFLTTSLPL
jgi:hypothetical protein